MRTLLIALLPAFAALSGCALTPNLDRQFGQSLRLAQAQQTLHPDAGRNSDAVSGLDAAAGAAAYDNYVRSFRTPEAHGSGFTIGVGSGTR